MSILVVGGDSVDAIKQRAHAGGHGCVEHWSGRKTRHMSKSIPKDTEAVVVVLDRVNHTLAGTSSPKRLAADYPSLFKNEASKSGRPIITRSI